MSADHAPTAQRRAAPRRRAAARRRAGARGARRGRARDGRQTSGRDWRRASRRARSVPSPTPSSTAWTLTCSGQAPTRVINATGVIVHTNLGRAPWPEAAIRAAEAAAREPLFLELDRATGRRGRRYRAVEEHLVALTGAEDALVTNNCAAALVLAVGLAGRKGVVVGRGELVEIGGGVRIPEIVRRAGARLVEVGTTNRTRVEDYAAPLAARARGDGPPRPPEQLRDGRLRGGPRRGRAGRPRPRPRRARRRRPGQRRPPRHGGVRPGPRADAGRATGRRRRPRRSSPATSSSAGRRRGWSSAGRTSSTASARTRWPGRCAPTRRRSPAWPPRLASTGPGWRRPRSRSGG